MASNKQEFKDFMVYLTVRLLKLTENGDFKGRASGFIYQPSGIGSPKLITAGHELERDYNFFETFEIINDQLMLLNGGAFDIFYDEEREMDYAYSVLPLQKYGEQECIALGKYMGYFHSFVKADKRGRYGFAVRNDYGEFIKTDKGFELPSYECSEIDLKLEEQTEHINYFKTTSEFQGHEFYKGASGSPIANMNGLINSILIGGDDEKGLLKGFRLDNIVF
ncbi:MAG: hypothetical protein LIR40_02855 [Bacteroidota bacterium]|nr:hypothetical protein [Bacteroidota bacterium]